MFGSLGNNMLNVNFLTDIAASILQYVSSLASYLDLENQIPRSWLTRQGYPHKDPLMFRQALGAEIPTIQGHRDSKSHPADPDRIAEESRPKEIIAIPAPPKQLDISVLLQSRRKKVNLSKVFS